MIKIRRKRKVVHIVLLEPLMGECRRRRTKLVHLESIGLFVNSFSTKLAVLVCESVAAELLR